MEDFQPITRALILTPKDNGNTYLTSYPLLEQLVSNGSLKSWEFYDTADASEEKMKPGPDDGSILVAGNAGSLPSILSMLKDQFKLDDTPSELQRGRYIYVFSDPKELREYVQDQDTKTVIQM